MIFHIGPAARLDPPQGTFLTGYRALNPSFAFVQISPFCKVVREKLVELELPHYYYRSFVSPSSTDVFSTLWIYYNVKIQILCSCLLEIDVGP